MSDGFLLDGNVSLDLREELAEPVAPLPVYFIGDGVAPPKQTPDPDILVWIEDHDCILLTHNRASMPVHLSDHLLAGRHVPGIIVFSKQPSVGTAVAQIVLLYGASLPGELRDHISYLPVPQRHQPG